jgi:galactokinase/mevalonate kinase-like predicted kinase
MFTIHSIVGVNAGLRVQFGSFLRLGARITRQLTQNTHLLFSKNNSVSNNNPNQQQQQQQQQKNTTTNEPNELKFDDQHC